MRACAGCAELEEIESALSDGLQIALAGCDQKDFSAVREGLRLMEYIHEDLQDARLRTVFKG